MPPPVAAGRAETTGRTSAAIIMEDLGFVISSGRAFYESARSARDDVAEEANVDGALPRLVCAGSVVSLLICKIRPRYLLM